MGVLSALFPILALGCGSAAPPTARAPVTTPASSASAAEPALAVPRGVPVPEALASAPPALRRAFLRAAALATPLVSDERRYEADFDAWRAHAEAELRAVDAETEALLEGDDADAYQGARVVRAMARTLVLRVWGERLPQLGDDRLDEELAERAQLGCPDDGAWRDACEEWSREADWALDRGDDEDALAGRMRSVLLRALPQDPQGVVRVHVATFPSGAYGALVDPTDAEVDATLRDRSAELERAFEANRQSFERLPDAILVSSIRMSDEPFVPDVGQELEDAARETLSAEEGAARILRRLAAGETFGALARFGVLAYAFEQRWMPVAQLQPPFDALQRAPCRGEVHASPVMARGDAWVLRCEARTTPPATFAQVERYLARELLRNEAGAVAARREAERALAHLRAGHSWRHMEEQVWGGWGTLDDADARPVQRFVAPSFVELTRDDPAFSAESRAAFFASTDPFPEAIVPLAGGFLVFEREAFVREDALPAEEEGEETRLRRLLEGAAARSASEE